MKTPEDIWHIEPDYQAPYDAAVQSGRDVAGRSSVTFLAIARNCMPFLTNTLECLHEAASYFGRSRLYVYENDSDDETAAVLDAFAASRQWVSVEHDTLQRPDYRGFQPERTIALAEYRNRCLEWARHETPEADYVVVLDLDPHGGFSPAGVLNSVGQIADLRSRTQRDCAVGGMASFSLWIQMRDGEMVVAHYDAWACRNNVWEDRKDKPGGMAWAHTMFPPVGSPPIRLNSAFGGLAVYAGEAIMAPGVHYAGGDCEHVTMHRSMRAAGYGMWLNPGCRYVAILP